jgi:phosphoglycerate dehydrogenase-like enzyme
MPRCLIVTSHAEDYAEAIARLADPPIPVTACPTPERALETYRDETVLFGDPGMIAQILPQMPTVEWVQSSWAGVTPLAAIRRGDYRLTGVRDVFGPQMSEYVLGYVLAHELKIRRRLKAQREHRWFTAHSGALEGKCLGIMGTGSIGGHLARTTAHFGIKVLGLSRSGRPAPGFEDVYPVTRLYDFLEQVDYLVSTLPHTTGTTHLLDGTALARLPAHACFINVGRSNVIDDEALTQALRNGTLAAAILDVFDEEPLPESSALWDTPNLTVTAHIAAVSHPSLIVPIFIDNYRRYIVHRPLKHEIDIDAGY